MSEIDDASRHLEAALARLDRAVAQRLAAGAPPAGPDAEMATALAEAQAESQRLQTLAGDVSRRLDEAIARIDRVLEG